MPPIRVLHVCMGNICRSPMAERLLMLVARQRLGKLDVAASPETLLRSSSAGTGGWHQGEEMNPPAARQIQLRGGSVAGFTARKLTGAHLADADLILTATADQLDYVAALLPEALGHTFVTGHLSRLLGRMDTGALPPAGVGPEVFAARATAVIEAADRCRAKIPATRDDDLDDPWGRGDQTFARIADDIEESMYALVDVLLPVAKR
ncbi:arsenate reductase/protein-tyrosine-phosphatase family protein [Mangrovihabitans endophyticus]|uniref:protein-tyrosine-phosphatase n=1 Tax=Mangrovihabitans endophyticus TaxID=1751298 RepID=A0A8J3C2V6_9ACTN|nr:phosphotyrosine protein phosphatase [Mangrovihabitans endophyticus]GGK99267.1 hypothetical protein GCM10012284_37110 [Mangrovihabitans endophyticus]